MNQETTREPTERRPGLDGPTGALAPLADGQRGMTLLEIMIVLAIIALVMGLLVGPKVLKSFQEAKGKTAEMMVKQFANEAYPRWTADNPGKSCPASLAELTKYLNKQDSKDPWGHKLIMFCGDNLPDGMTQPFGVLSKGPDGKQGTKDDVKSW